MNDKLGKFCVSVHENLDALEGRIDSLKLNIVTTWHYQHEKLDELRHKDEATKLAVTETRANLERWLRETKTESKCTIDQWIEKHETQKLAARAQKAEDGAEIAIAIVRASIDDAERMILEAIAARRDAAAVTNG
jgi:hypothetical protein